MTTNQSQLTVANKYFREGDFSKAADYYSACLSYWKQIGSAPKSLMTVCEAKLLECQKKLKSLDLDIIEPASNSTIPTDFISGNASKFVRNWPKVSVVIPHFNSGGLIYEALDSIMRQNFHDLETLIIDDCSTDACLYEGRLSSYPDWMQLRLIVMPKNSGPSPCRNRGIQEALGRAICFLDADDYLESDSLKSRWEILNKKPVVGGAFSAMRYVDAEGQPLGQIILNSAKSFSFIDFVSNKFPCSALMIRKSTLCIDPFNEELVFGEDYECFSRIAQRGWIYRFASDGMIGYRQHGSSITHKDPQKDLESRTAVIERVHHRELMWSHNQTTSALPSVSIVNEVSGRTFPVACIFALRGDLDNAQKMSDYIDPDSVAAREPSQCVGAIRFFLTREDYVPAEQVSAFLKTADRKSLCAYLNTLFFNRHRKFVTDLLHELFGEFNCSEQLLNVVRPTLIQMTWSDFLDGSDANWRGYLLIHRNVEKMPPEACDATRRFLQGRGDLEGIFALRYAINGGRVYTDINSIAPDNPDSSLLGKLGQELMPALVLHEFAARSLKHWTVQKIHDQGLHLPDTIAVERLVLAGVAELRLKLIGGVSDCYVVQNLTGVAA